MTTESTSPAYRPVLPAWSRVSTPLSIGLLLAPLLCACASTPAPRAEPPPSAPPPVVAEPAPETPAQRIESRLSALQNASDEELVDSKLPELRAQLDALPEEERAPLEPAYREIAEKSDQAKYKAARARCGETHVTTQAISTFLKQSANDPKSIKVESCADPVLTERCWQVQCDFRSRDSKGANVKQRANFYAEGENIVAIDVL